MSQHRKWNRILKLKFAKTSFLRRLTFLWVLLSATPIFADYVIHVGPVSDGGGGPNPLSIPPVNILEYEFVWITPKESEWRFSLTPGIFFGDRYTSSTYNTYVSLGGGLVTDINGAGPGVYTAFGYDHCNWFCFNMEILQAVGIGGDSLLSPYAVRIGVTIEK